ncbi:phosphorylase [Methylobacterium sp. Leaf104]|uniref:phosphorylase n=1 Tax=Methylobacterium TaxID=407 RepID=UPI0006F8A82E|nr:MULTISPECIES: phosphorylase [Methylobacterium]KQP31053.1 phosphorylase [Methylobacterium sp. Leaf104]MCI9881132.1 phosphorylase [Methylobacterium goesingense]
MSTVTASGALPVLAVTGLAKEARLASGPGVLAVGAGGDPERLRARLAARPTPGCRAVVSIGIAGGLDPALVPGDVLVATAIVTPARRYGADPSIAAAWMRALAGSGPTIREGALAGVDAAVLDVAAKAALRDATGSAGVDMESHVAAAYAERHGLPFAALRIVCDPADRAIPAFAAQALKPDGEPDIRAVLVAIARQPSQIPALIRLARDSGRAFRSLTRCRARLGTALGVPAP